MNVAFVSDVVYPEVKGGAQKRIHEIATRLAAREHEVTIYGRHYWDGPAERTREGIQYRAVARARDLYVDGRRSIVEAVGFGASLLAPLRRKIASHDVVVASVFPYFPVLAAAACAVGRETPLVTTWHEVWRDYWTEYLGPLGPGGALVERLTARVPQHPVAVSGFTADRLAEIGPARADIDVVPNGIDVDRVRATPPAPEGFDVLFAGRLTQAKNVDLLLTAFDRVADRHDARLGIVGDGPARAAAERAAADLSHPDRVAFLGFLEEYETVLAHLCAAPVFASASTREGFGITLLEAMAADCTVVTVGHADSAAEEVVGDAGFVVEANEAALARALDRALDGDRPPADPRQVARRYDWDRIADRALAVYRTAAVEG